MITFILIAVVSIVAIGAIGIVWQANNSRRSPGKSTRSARLDSAKTGRPTGIN